MHTPSPPPLPLPPLTEEQIMDMVHGNASTEWRYEMRRECQEILPGLLLGPFQVSKSLEMLTNLQITHIVCIRDVKEAFSVRPRFQDKFKYLTLDVEDNEEQNLIRVFPKELLPRAKGFIDTALQGGGKVLVHCNGGISLSPAFVVMFAMEYYRLAWEDALRLVQNRRYCISPNSGFLTQIKEYESIYKANLAIAGNSSTTPHGGFGGRKRKDNEDEDSRNDDRKRPLVRDRHDDPDNMMI